MTAVGEYFDFRCLEHHDIKVHNVIEITAIVTAASEYKWEMKYSSVS